MTVRLGPGDAARARRLVAEGRPVAEVAAELGIGWRTVYRVTADVRTSTRGRYRLDRSSHSVVAICQRCGERGIGGTDAAAIRATLCSCS